MSQKRIRANAPKPSPSAKPKLWLIFLIVGLSGVAIYIYGGMVADDNRLAHLSTPGKISETRVVVDHTRDARWGRRIYYRLEARVAFTINGESFDRWLPVPLIDSSREFAEALVSHHPQECTVYWLPEHLEKAQCRIEIGALIHGSLRQWSLLTLARLPLSGAFT